MLPFIGDLEREPVVEWGAALADLDREGIQLKLRVPGDDVERSLAGPLDELTEMLIDWLVRRDLCRPTPTPAWWVAPTGDELVLSERDESSALFRLSPHLLRQLGDTLAAHSRSTTLERDADADDLAWLRKIDAL